MLANMVWTKIHTEILSEKLSLMFSEIKMPKLVLIIFVLIIEVPGVSLGPASTLDNFLNVLFESRYRLWSSDHVDLSTLKQENIKEVCQNAPKEFNRVMKSSTLSPKNAKETFLFQLQATTNSKLRNLVFPSPSVPQERESNVEIDMSILISAIVQMSPRIKIIPDKINLVRILQHSKGYDEKHSSSKTNDILYVHHGQALLVASQLGEGRGGEQLLRQQQLCELI